MSEQPNALRLADLLRDESGVDGYVHDEAATELVRLHEAREQDRRAMRGALEALIYHTQQTRPIVASQVAIHHLRQRLEQP